MGLVLGLTDGKLCDRLLHAVDLNLEKAKNTIRNFERIKSDQSELMTTPKIVEKVQSKYLIQKKKETTTRFGSSSMNDSRVSSPMCMVR